MCVCPVEDPSAVFSSMRLALNCRNCMNLSQFSPAVIKKGLTKEHYEVGRAKLKLNKVRRTISVINLVNYDIRTGFLGFLENLEMY